MPVRFYGKSLPLRIKNKTLDRSIQGIAFFKKSVHKYTLKIDFYDFFA